MNTKSIKSYIFLLGLIGLMFLSISCSKEDSVTNPDDNNQPDPINPTEVKINSYTPLKPMWGDVIEIIGEGFPNNINDVSVFFPGNQLSILDSVPTGAEGYTCRGTVLETSQTRIKVRIPYNTFINSQGNPAPLTKNNGYGQIAVKVKDKPLYTTAENYIYYKSVPFINWQGISPVGISGVYIKPGEKFKVEGKGFGITPTEGTLSVNGTPILVDSVWFSPIVYGEGCWNMMATLPAGLGTKTNDLSTYNIKYTRYNRSVEYTLQGISLPKLTVSGTTLPAQLTPTSTTDFHITGKHLYANVIRFGDGTFTEEVAITGASLTATDVTAFIPLANLLPRGDRTYTVVLYDTILNQSYGIIGSVRVIP
jgi:hypothetical protein